MCIQYFRLEGFSSHCTKGNVALPSSIGTQLPFCGGAPGPDIDHPPPSMGMVLQPNMLGALGFNY